MVQALTDADPSATVLSIDGIGAFDLVSMLEGLRRVEGGDSALPFVSQFYGSPSSYSWEDDDGQVYTLTQAEVGEQGDPMMPALFSLAQHPALEGIQRRLRDNERLLAFLDDIYVVCLADRVSSIHNVARGTLPTFCNLGPRKRGASACRELERGTKCWSPPQEEAGCLSGAARRDGLRLQACARTGCECRRECQHVVHRMSRHKESPPRGGASEGTVSQGLGTPQWKSGARNPPRDHGCQPIPKTADPWEESSLGETEFPAHIEPASPTGQGCSPSP